MQLNTLTEVKAAKTAELVDAYNQLTGKSIKKFKDRAAAERQTWNIIETIIPKHTEIPVKAAASSKRENYANRIIRILQKENPKRPNRRAHGKYAILLKMDGKTLREFKKEEGKHPSLDIEAGWPATELRWALKLGLIKLEKE